MKFLIVGGGIGGLSAAISLQQDGHDVVIYERVTDLRPVGAAISVWSNGVKVLNALGVGKEIEALGGQMHRMCYRKHDTGETLCDFALDNLYTRVKQRAYPIGRSELQRVLVDAATKGRPNILKLGKKAIDYTISDSTVTLRFEDGSSDSGDFLVIADGTHSRLRDRVCGRPIERKYVGYVNYNGPIAISALNATVPAHSWTQFVGDGKRVSMMPMGGDRFYFFLDVTLPKGSASAPEQYQAELADVFKDWHEAVQHLIQNLDPSKMARVEIHDTEALPTLVDGCRAVLIGDAAHATAPDLGQGGCLAMEDAFVLATLFRKEGFRPGTTDREASLQRVVEQYQALRGARVAGVVQRARKRAEVTHALAGMEQTQEWYKELASEDGTHIMEGMAKTILGAPKELDGNDNAQPVVSDGHKPLLTEIADSS